MKTTTITLKNSHVENDTQHMTSLEIAELTGKQHFHVMEAIRKMEPAWVKVFASNFRLASRTIVVAGVRAQSKVAPTGVRPQSKVADDCTLAPDPRPADSTLAPDPGAVGATWGGRA